MEKEKDFSWEIRHYKEVDSTNLVALDLALRGEKEGVVIVAEKQHQGRGKGGREWFSPSGGLWLSLLLKPDFFPPSLSYFNLLGALGVTRTIKGLFPWLDPVFKPPNDVYLGGQKVAGILTQTRTKKGKLDFAIVGIGVNLNLEKFPPSLKTKATSLRLKTGMFTPPSEFLSALLEEIKRLYFLLRKDPLKLKKEAESLFSFSEEGV